MLMALVQFNVGSYELPIEQGNFVRPSLLRHLHQYNPWKLGLLVMSCRLLSLLGHEASAFQPVAGC